MTSYRDAPNPGPLYGWAILPTPRAALRGSLYAPTTPPAWYSSSPQPHMSPFPSDQPAPMLITPEILAGACGARGDLRKGEQLHRDDLRKGEQLLSDELHKGERFLRSELTGEAVITSPYGPRLHPVHKRYRLHKGIDIRAPIGTPCYGPSAGTVVRVIPASPDREEGLTLYFRTLDGYLWGYMHLSQVLAPPGAYVERGQALALTGASGAGTGPHLHFLALDPSGEAVDPVSLFAPGTFRQARR